MKEVIVPDYSLDMRGEPCPYPAIATLGAIERWKVKFTFGGLASVTF